jgi:mono/diheme cytochrome c family protein
VTLRAHLLLGCALFIGATLRSFGGTNATVGIRDTLHGHFVYSKNCAVCHGKRGDGKGEMGLTVKPLPRDFRTGVFKYRSTPAGFLPTDADLARVIRHGIPDTAMPIFSTLPERDVRAVVDYIKTFSPRWRDAANYAAPLPIPPRPEWFEEQLKLRTHVERGRQQFLSSCSPCHGERGDGHGVVTNLVDLAGNPTPARDLARAALRSGERVEDIYRVISTGLDSTPMPAFANAFTEEQLWELVAFIHELRRAPATRDN